MFGYFYKKIALACVLLSLNLFVSPQQLYSMQTHDNVYNLPTQGQLVNEINHVIDSTPTGFTYIIQRCTSNLYVIASLSWQILRHPVASYPHVIRPIFSGTRDGVKSLLAPVAEPIIDILVEKFCNPVEAAEYLKRRQTEASSGSLKRKIHNSARLILTITLHPMVSISKLLHFLDNVKKDDLPIIGKAVQGYALCNGFIKISPENCPLLDKMLEQTAEKLGCKDLGFYIFKGNVFTKILENLGSADFSANAMTIGYTHGTSFIYIGKDLFLGVNQNQASYIQGMSPEQIQAICAHEISHKKFRHPLLLTIFNLVGVSLLTWFLVDTLFDSAKDISGTNILYNMMVGYFGTKTYAVLRNTTNQLLSQGLSRRHEQQADLNGLNALEHPEEMASALTKLHQLATFKRRPLLELFMDHPDIGTRVNYLQQGVARIHKAQAATTTTATTTSTLTTTTTTTSAAN